MSVQESIRHKLGEALLPVHIEVQNESGNHNVPEGSESHFKVVVVSDAFDGKPLVAQHRMIYEVLASELSNGVHALALHTFTRAQWAARNPDVTRSPQCLGGKARENGGAV